MSANTPCDEQTGALVAFERTHDQPWSCPPDFREPSEPERLRELRQLLIQGISNGDVCIKTMNDFWASSSDWYRRIYEQVMSSRQALEQRLSATMYQLAASQTALHQEMASCAALQQALAAEKAKLTAERDRADELSVRYTFTKEANAGLIESNAKLSEANAQISKVLYNVTSLDDGGGRMSVV